ncbi:hypothetical protein FQR65_LT07595 [Abscondita terminalis]|nr:hypothetical protein FQR65_LT07595 [Abscondita terminalis]
MYSLVRAYLNKELDEMITSVMDKMFTEDDTLVFIYDEFVELELPDVIQNQYVIGRASNPTTLILDKPGKFIIHLSDEKTLNDTIYFFYDSGFFENIYSIQGRYLVVINEKNLTSIHHLFSQFWSSKYIRDVVVLTYNTESEVFGKVYTSDPLHEKNVCGTKTNVVDSKLYNQNVSIEFKKNYQNIHKCGFSCYWSQSDLKYVFYKFFDKVFDVLDKQINGSYVRFLNNDISIPLPSKTLTCYLYVINDFRGAFKVFDILNFGWSDPLYFVVRSGEEVSSVKLLMIVFSTEVWIFIIITYIATSLTLWFMMSIEKKKFFISQLARIFLEVFSATLSGWFSFEPKKSKIRCIFICYLFYHIHIYTGFTCNLVTILTTPQFEPGISNLEELADSNITIHSRGIYRTYFEIEYEELNNLRDKIKDKIEYAYKVPYDRFVDLLMTDNTGLLLTELDIKYLRHKLSSNLRINVIDAGIIIRKPQEFLTSPPGHYMRDTFNLFFRYIDESGISKKYMSDILDDIKLKTKETRLAPLNLNHLLSAFVFLALGLILSTIILTLEVLVRKYI